MPQAQADALGLQTRRPGLKVKLSTLSLSLCGVPLSCHSVQPWRGTGPQRWLRLKFKRHQDTPFTLVFVVTEGAFLYTGRGASLTYNMNHTWNTTEDLISK